MCKTDRHIHINGIVPPQSREATEMSVNRQTQYAAYAENVTETEGNPGTCFNTDELEDMILSEDRVIRRK